VLMPAIDVKIYADAMRRAGTDPRTDKLGNIFLPAISKRRSVYDFVYLDLWPIRGDSAQE
jgi:hypothetical protein